jgi:GT2 family glycosyltransferase
VIELSDNGWPHSAVPFRTDPPLNTVGIVIPMRDGMKFFKLCLYSILNFTFPPYMLTVVDNLSGLRTKRQLRSLSQNHPIEILRYDETFNFSAQVNLGLRHVFSFPNVKYGLILNADTVVEPDWLTHLLEVINSDKYGAVGPLSNVAIPEQEGRRENIVELTHRLSGLCMLIKREAFEDIGGFDEQFVGGGYEDQDFTRRLFNAGWKLGVVRSVHVHHFHRAFRTEKKHTEEMELNRVRFNEKHLALKGELK